MLADDTLIFVIFKTYRLRFFGANANWYRGYVTFNLFLFFILPCTSVFPHIPKIHYNNVIMGTIASQITSLTIVYSTNYSDASLAFVRGIHQGPVNSPYKWPVTRKMFPFHDVIMIHTIYIPHRLPQYYTVKTTQYIVRLLAWAESHRWLPICFMSDRRQTSRAFMSGARIGLL